MCEVAHMWRACALYTADTVVCNAAEWLLTLPKCFYEPFVVVEIRAGLSPALL